MGVIPGWRGWGGVQPDPQDSTSGVRGHGSEVLLLTAGDCPVQEEEPQGSDLWGSLPGEEPHLDTPRPPDLRAARGLREKGRHLAIWTPVGSSSKLARCPCASQQPLPSALLGRVRGGRVRGRAGEVGFTLRIGAHSCHSERVGLFFFLFQKGQFPGKARIPRGALWRSPPSGCSLR